MIPNRAHPSNIPIVLNNGEHRTLSRYDGSFVFFHVPSGRKARLSLIVYFSLISHPGIYALEVYSLTDHFSQLKLKVSAENNTISVIEYKYPGAPRVAASYPIVLNALAPIQYEVQKPPFSLWGMIMANPMMLMMLFSLVMVVGMPYLMQNMSPEELEEIKRQSAKNGDPMKQLSQLMGGGKAANDDDDDDEDDKK